MKYVYMILWSPVLLLQWIGIKTRTVAKQLSAARTQSRARLVASSTKKAGRYEDNLPRG